MAKPELNPKPSLLTSMLKKLEKKKKEEKNSLFAWLSLIYILSEPAAIWFGQTPQGPETEQ